MAMVEMLKQHWDRYMRKYLEEEAASWEENGFSVQEADQWCSVGFWNAATAAEFRSAGVTPEQVKAAAERIAPDGDLIYDTCNGHTPTRVLLDAVRKGVRDGCQFRDA
jgi:hypothetical protein